MVESEAKELSEDVMLGAVMFGHKQFQPVIEAIIRLAEKAAKEPCDYQPADTSEVEKAVLAIAEADLRAAYKITDKQERYGAVDAAKAKVMSALCPAEGEAKSRAEKVKARVQEAEAKIVRWDILDNGTRIDGRDLKTVRPIVAEVGILPRTHGSALFTRGETQALGRDHARHRRGRADDRRAGGHLQGNFMLHYNFPPYSVGEAGRMGSPGRREIGHGKLAWRALHPMLPAGDEFPYTIRVVSEITESNGSSSMATVCGGSLALMDAGVPLKASGRGHRHGPDPRRRALRGALRHPRRRGSSRRHGLQGRRHGRRHHLAADGHQDRRHHRGDHARRPRPGEGRPRRTSSARWPRR